MKDNISSQASSAGTPPTPVSSTTFLDSALSQNVNLDPETTAWKNSRDLTVDDIVKAAPPELSKLSILQSKHVSKIAVS